MTHFSKLTLLSAALAAFLLPAAAQNSTTPNNPASTTPGTPESAQRVDQRENRQQERIANGVKDSELTPSEVSNLEHKESQINTEEQQMKNADHGQLTAADRAKLQQQQNQGPVFNKDLDKEASELLLLQKVGAPTRTTS